MKNLEKFNEYFNKNDIFIHHDNEDEDIDQGDIDDIFINHDNDDDDEDIDQENIDQEDIDQSDDWRVGKRKTFNGEAIHSFIFIFSLDDGSKSAIGIIPFLSEPDYEFDDRSDMMDLISDACFEHDLEHYGVHDGGYGEVEEVDGLYYEAIFGFDSYEVEENKIEELMYKWKDIFDNELGFTTGDVIIRNPFEFQYMDPSM